MAARWTAEQVADLAPDPGTLSRARTLGSGHRWTALGRDDRAVWGRTKGSGGTRYEVAVDREGPASRCSCPSRRRPCKHAIGLALVDAAHEAPDAERPPAVARWLQERDGRRAKAAARREPTVEDPEAEARRAAGRDKRRRARQEKVAAGVADLRERLRDVVRRGLAQLGDESYAYWDEVAARMVDAQAPGLSRMVRGLSGLPFTGEGWQGRMLDRLARLHLLLRAYERLDELEPDLRREVRSLVGFPESKDRLLAGEGLRDRWWSLGQALEEREMLRMRRVWLWGERSRRWALLLDFAPLGGSFGLTIPGGACVDAELVFYPGTWPVRALVKESHGLVADATDPAGAFTSVDEAFDRMSTLVSRQPWADGFPLGLEAVHAVPDQDRLSLSDEGASLPVARGFPDRLTLLSISGGGPLRVFGEWRRGALLPMSAWLGTRLVALETSEELDA